MLPRTRAFFAACFSSPSPVAEPKGFRSEIPAVLGAAAIGIWMFAYKLQIFRGLGTTSDLYQFTQLATSWLDGKFIQDNCWGNTLSIHTYFFCPLLALFAVPLGAIGLLLCAALALAFGTWGLTRVLRLFAVPRALALTYAFVAALAPVSAHFYEDRVYGFHVELLVPCLAVWLFYFLLKRNWPGTIALTLGLLSVKEDSALIAASVAAIVLVEELIRRLAPASDPLTRRMWNRPALAVIFASAMAVPLCLHLLKSQSITGYSAGNFQRLNLADASTVDNGSSLAAYVSSHLFSWLHSSTVSSWLVMALVLTGGLIVFRPHLVLIGVLGTLISWLMQDDLWWPPRMSHAYAFFQIAGCLGLVSAWTLYRACRAPGFSPVKGYLLLAGATAGACFGTWQQWQRFPEAEKFYRLSPTFALNASERAQADQLFAQYRREGRKEEPVIASDYLFRYAHDRNLFWYSRLSNRPAPEWILWDEVAKPLPSLRMALREAHTDLDDYEQRGQAGRFLLYQRRPAGAAAPHLVGALSISGEPYGTVRMKVRFAGGKLEGTEPLLSIGRNSSEDVFFVRYLNRRQLALGLESAGTKVQQSGPIDYDPAQAYDLEFFCGSLLAPAGNAPLDSMAAARRADLQDLAEIRWGGREILHARSTPHAAAPSEVSVGGKTGDTGSLPQRFSGEISAVSRGGYPPSGKFEDSFGSVLMTVELPGATEGIPEPLLVVGHPGEAYLGYVRVLPGKRLSVGLEIWGVGSYESEPVPTHGEQPVTILFDLPALFPPLGDARWGAVATEAQAAAQSRFRIRVDGATALERTLPTRIPRLDLLHVGENPIGGSLVSARFTGKILQHRQLPLAAP